MEVLFCRTLMKNKELGQISVFNPRFPDFQAGSDEVSARSLRDKLRKFFGGGKGEKLKGERRIKLTFVGDHNHDTGLCEGGHLPFTDEPFAMVKSNADPVMIDRIHQLVRQGCTRLKECQSRLHRDSWVPVQWSKFVYLGSIVNCSRWVVIN